MLTARDMAQGDSVLKCKLAPQRMDCPLLPCTASCGVIRGGWCGQLAWDYPGKKGIANDVSMPSLLRGRCNTSDSSPSLQERCVCSGHVPAAHPFGLRWIAGVARVLTPPKPTHKGSINWHTIPSLMMKCPFCLRLLNLKLNFSWAWGGCGANRSSTLQTLALTPDTHVVLPSDTFQKSSFSRHENILTINRNSSDYMVIFGC